MNPRRSWLGAALGVGLIYPVVGLATAYLARSAASPEMRTVWRLAAWALCLAAFVSHFIRERLLLRSSAFGAALHTAAAVALGALALAAAGPIRSHWSAPDQWSVALRALILWPIVTGVPAFLVALAGGALIGRRAPARQSDPA